MRIIANVYKDKSKIPLNRIMIQKKNTNTKNHIDQWIYVSMYCFEIYE